MQLVKYEAARKALQAAHSVDEVKQIKDRAEAVRAYARQAGDVEMQNWAVEIKLRAERRAGELLQVLDKNAGGRPITGSSITTSLSSLKSMGISKSQSSKWQKLAAVPEVKFESILAKAKASTGELTSIAVLREAVQRPARAKKRQDIANEAAKAGEKLPAGTLFPVALADCPWRYDFSKTVNRDIENHYTTMTVEELCDMPVKDIFAKNCVLFFWATAPKLLEALKVIKAWGFEYKTHAVWDKEKMGMGYWFRGQHELLLVATKGDIPCPEDNVRVSSVIRSRRGQHSEKPENVYKIIEHMYTDLQKIELFARKERKGWTSWGKQL